MSLNYLMYGVLILLLAHMDSTVSFYECSSLRWRRRKRKRNHASTPLAKTNVRGYRRRLDSSYILTGVKRRVLSSLRVAKRAASHSCVEVLTETRARGLYRSKILVHTIRVSNKLEQRTFGAVSLI